jgi:hypothetical protein
MKILILGHGEHGKDTVAEIITHCTGLFGTDFTGLRFESSSRAAAELAVMPALAEKYGYKTVEECFDDRRNHREEWKQLITDYNTPDKSRLCREIIARCDGYVGMRCPEEYAAVKHLFDYVIWVDASKRKPLDPSMGIERDDSMAVIDNNDCILNCYINTALWAQRAGLC